MKVAAAHFTDPEAPGHFNAEPGAIRAEYRRRYDSFLNEVQGHCQARGCDWYLARTTDNLYAFLRDCYLSREQSR